MLTNIKEHKKIDNKILNNKYIFFDKNSIVSFKNKK
jgi:hypothetical protein